MHFNRHTLTRLALATCATLGLAPTGTSQTEVFGTTHNAVGIARHDLDHFDGMGRDLRWLSRSLVHWGDRRVAVDLDIELKYSFSKLVGEPVWGFVPRYTFGRSLKIEGGHEIVRKESWDDDRVELDFDGSNSTLSVAANLFDRIRIRNFYFYASLVALPDRMHVGGMRRAWTHINMVLPGITDRAGKWGWDVPGSPAWNRALLWQSEDLIDGHQHSVDDYHEPEVAKEMWNRMLKLAEDGETQLLHDFRAYRVDLSLMDFTTAVERAQPGATRHLFEARVSDEDKDPLAWQLRSLMRGVRRDVESRRDPNGAVLTDGRLRRRMQIVDDAVRELAGPEHATIVRTWADLQREIAQSALEADILQIGKAVATRLGKKPEKLPRALTDAANQVLLQLESSDAASPELRQRWEEIQRVLELIGGSKRSVYMFAVATTKFEKPFRHVYGPNPLVLTQTRAGERITKEQREEMRRRREKRRRKEAAAAAERARLLAQRQERELQFVPDPTRTDVHRALVKEEWSSTEIESEFTAWAGQNLASSQRPRIELKELAAATEYRVYAFATPEEAEAAAKKLQFRVIRAKPPANKTPADKPAQPK